MNASVRHVGVGSITQRPSRTRTFLRHVVEMTVAMMLGMCVLGMAFRGIHLAVFGSGFDAAWQRTHRACGIRDDLQHDAADGRLDAPPRPQLGTRRRDGSRDGRPRARAASGCSG